MSVWATIFSLDDEHPDTCGTRDTPPSACTCGQPGAPIRYRRSHILPTPDDPRGGYLGLAEIPSHITRDGRADAPEDGVPWPWLRMSTERDVVLDEGQVGALRDALSAWLDSRNADGIAVGH